MAAPGPVGGRLMAALFLAALVMAPVQVSAAAPPVLKPSAASPPQQALAAILKQPGVSGTPAPRRPSALLPAPARLVLPGLNAGAAAIMAAPAPMAVRPTSNVVPGVPFIWQSYALDCESAALQMALAHEGIQASQDEIMDILGSDLRQAYWDALGLRWGDPYATFVGNVDGSEDYLTGYGTYFPAIARAAEALQARVLRAGENLAPQEIYDAILDGHPVVLWVSADYSFHPRQDYVSFDGRRVLYAGPFEHAVTGAGVSETGILIHDPLAGQIWVDKPVFEDTFRTYNQMAVILD